MGSGSFLYAPSILQMSTAGMWNLLTRVTYIDYCKCLPFLFLLLCRMNVYTVSVIIFQYTIHIYMQQYRKCSVVIVSVYRFSSSIFRSVPFCCRTQGEYCIILYNTAVAVGYETHMRNMKISDQQQAIMDWRYPFPHLLISHVQITAYSYCIPRDRLTGYLSVSECTLLIPYRYKTIVNR